MAKLPTLDERTKNTAHRCTVSGCDGIVRRRESPILWSAEDRTSLHPDDPDFKLPPVPADVPKRAKYFYTMSGTLGQACLEAVEYAGILEQAVAFHFNEMLVVVEPGDDADAVYVLAALRLNGTRRWPAHYHKPDDGTYADVRRGVIYRGFDGKEYVLVSHHDCGFHMVTRDGDTYACISERAIGRTFHPVR